MTFKQIKEFSINLISSIMYGTILKKLKVDSYLPHIIVTLIFFWLCIWARMEVEKTMTVYEENKQEIEDRTLQNIQLNLDYASLFRISRIESLLVENDSKVTFPDIPASTIK